MKQPHTFWCGCFVKSNEQIWLAIKAVVQLKSKTADRTDCFTWDERTMVCCGLLIVQHVVVNFCHEPLRYSSQNHRIKLARS